MRFPADGRIEIASNTVHPADCPVKNVPFAGSSEGAKAWGNARFSDRALQAVRLSIPAPT